MSRGAQEGGEEAAQGLAPAPLGPTVGEWQWRAHSLFPLKFLFLMVVQGMRIPAAMTGIDGLPGGTEDPPRSCDANPMSRVSSRNKPLLTGLLFQKHFFLERMPPRVSSLGRY